MLFNIHVKNGATRTKCSMKVKLTAKHVAQNKQDKVIYLKKALEKKNALVFLLATIHLQHQTIGG